MPDLNVWLALSWAGHMYSEAAWAWFSKQEDARFFFCRFTQLGLMRLLATSSIMGEDLCTAGEGWKIYDRWIEDSRVSLKAKPFDLDAAFRDATKPYARLSSPKALGDSYLLAISRVTDSTLVTLDRGLAAAGRKAKRPMVLLAD